jgi:hypothetical protein
VFARLSYGLPTLVRYLHGHGCRDFRYALVDFEWRLAPLPVKEPAITV